MKQKVIFLDLDGTLVVPGGITPPQSAIQAVKTARTNGHRVFLCTGRSYVMVEPLLKYGFDGVIASAGGYITCGNEVLYDHPMTPEQFQHAITTLHKNKVFCTIEGKDLTYGDEMMDAFLHGHDRYNTGLERWRKMMEENFEVLPYEQYDGCPVYKIIFLCREESQLVEPRALLEEEFDFCLHSVPRYNYVNGELINRAFDKGRAIRRVCEHLGVSLEDTIGFGDSRNDLEMMRTVGVGVAMEDGNDEVKAIATHVCPPLAQDGIYHGFAQCGLL